jgi:hypothetical protein
LEDQPELLNSDPYGNGWIIKLEIAEGADHSELLSAEEYQQSLDKISKIFSKILPIYWAFLTYMLLKPGEENHEYWFMFSGIDKICI